MNTPLQLLHLFIVALCVAGISAESYGQENGTWFRSGAFPCDYGMGGDPTMSHDSTSVSFIRSSVSTPRGFDTWMVTLDVKPYLGKRIGVSFLLLAPCGKWGWALAEGE